MLLISTLVQFKYAIIARNYILLGIYYSYRDTLARIYDWADPALFQSGVIKFERQAR